MVLLVACALAVACRAQEDDFDDWNHNRKYHGVEYQKIKKLQKPADAGDGAAAFEIGLRCLQKDNDKICTTHGTYLAAAQFWLHKAADLGYKDGAGEGFAGLLYSQQPEMETETLFWYRRSAEHGSAFGSKQLAGYLQGHPNVPGAKEEAFALLRAAGQRGDISAMVSVGSAYLSGSGVGKDVSQADAWFSRAEQSLNGYTSDEIAFNEYLMGSAYQQAGLTASALKYLLWAGQRPAYYDSRIGLLKSYGQQEALKLMGEIYRDGKGVPANQEYAQTCFNLRQQLIDQVNAQQAADDAEQAANNERNRQENNARIMGGFSSLASAVGSLNQPSPIQQTANQQLANIAAKQGRAQQAQALKPPPAAPVTTATNRASTQPRMPEKSVSPAPAPKPVTKAPDAPGTGCQRVDYTVRVESQWFTPHDPNREVVYWVTNDTIAPVTCTFAFHKNGQWTEYVSGTYPANAVHVGGQGRGSWTMGADSSDIKFECFQGSDPVDTNGHLCNDHLVFTGMTSAGSDWTPAPPRSR